MSSLNNHLNHWLISFHQSIFLLVDYFNSVANLQVWLCSWRQDKKKKSKEKKSWKRQKNKEKEKKNEQQKVKLFTFSGHLTGQQALTISWTQCVGKLKGKRKGMKMIRVKGWVKMEWWKEEKWRNQRINVFHQQSVKSWGVESYGWHPHHLFTSSCLLHWFLSWIRWTVFIQRRSSW